MNTLSSATPPIMLRKRATSEPNLTIITHRLPVLSCLPDVTPIHEAKDASANGIAPLSADTDIIRTSRTRLRNTSTRPRSRTLGSDNQRGRSTQTVPLGLSPLAHCTDINSRAALSSSESDGSRHGDIGDIDPEAQLAAGIIRLRSERRQKAKHAERERHRISLLSAKLEDLAKSREQVIAVQDQAAVGPEDAGDDGHSGNIDDDEQQEIIDRHAGTFISSLASAIFDLRRPTSNTFRTQTSSAYSGGAPHSLDAVVRRFVRRGLPWYSMTSEQAPMTPTGGVPASPLSASSRLSHSPSRSHSLASSLSSTASYLPLPFLSRSASFTSLETLTTGRSGASTPSLLDEELDDHRFHHGYDFDERELDKSERHNDHSDTSSLTPPSFSPQSLFFGIAYDPHSDSRPVFADPTVMSAEALEGPAASSISMRARFFDEANGYKDIVGASRRKHVALRAGRDARPLTNLVRVDEAY